MKKVRDNELKTKKMLICSTDLMMIQFLIPHVFFLKEHNYDVEIVCSEVGQRLEEVRQKANGIAVHQVSLCRSPFKMTNIKGYKELKKLFKNKFYDMIWTNEPVMGSVTRLAARRTRKKGTKVMYMTHGYHFFKGGEYKYKIFYLIEKIFSKMCDMIVTINYEDYELTKKKFYVKSVKHIDGIGVDLKTYRKPIEIGKKKEELGIAPEKFVIMSVGELKEHKNHEIIIGALAELHIPNIVYVICGQGELLEKLRNKAKTLEVQDQVVFLGYRRDVPEILQCADIFVFPSKREGLGLASLEAMATGLPIIGSNVRGIVDYVINGKTGFLCEVNNATEYANAIARLYQDSKLRDMIKKENVEFVKKYDIENIKFEILKICNELCFDINVKKENQYVQ